MTIQQLLSPFRRAVNDYKLISNGDKIAVGVSGGKDSLVLLTIMREFQKYFDLRFDLMGITVDMGFKNDAYAPVAEYCDKIGVEYSVVKTDIAQIVFDVRKESNPCSLCAKMRRGALNGEIVAKGFNKLALGHHLDDVVETFMLSLFYEGRLNTFAPKSFMSRSGVTLIRPMVYIAEKDLAGIAKTMPVVNNPCPANHNTERESMKSLLKEFSQKYPDLPQKFANAIMHPERYNLWDKTDK